MKGDSVKDKTSAYDFTPENLDRVKDLMQRYPPGKEKSAVLPVMDLMQRQCGGWLPHPALESVARILGLPLIRVMEVASFYSMFHLRPVGKYHLQVCTTTPCYLRGGEDLVQVCRNKFGLRPHDVSEDGKYSFEEVECLGACVNAPVVQINDEFYEDLDAESFQSVVSSLGEKKRVSSSESAALKKKETD